MFGHDGRLSVDIDEKLATHAIPINNKHRAISTTTIDNHRRDIDETFGKTDALFDARVQSNFPEIYFFFFFLLSRYGERHR